MSIKGRQYSCFSGNNYLGLSNHPKMIEKVVDSVQRYGINFSASRKTTGTSDIHLSLEDLLSDFKKCESSIVFASGYFGNSLLLHALKDRYSAVFIDSQAHPSITDSIPKDIKVIEFYDHLNTDHLEALLRQHKNIEPMIITDGLFALTGEIAPLDKISTLAMEFQALLVVDDAHATGVLGNHGRGTPEHFDIQSASHIYQTETMSKALGSYGGFISSTSEIIDKIQSTSTFYAASTALPPSVVSAGIFSIQYIQNHPEIRLRLLNNARVMKKSILEMGFKTINSVAPIIPLFFDQKKNAEHLSKYLEAQGFIVPAIDYPVKTGRHMLRMTTSAGHTEHQIEELLFHLKKWADQYGTN